MTAPVSIREHNPGDVTDRGHKQIRIEGYGFEAVLDEGIAEDVMMLWRRRIPTFASCEGPEEPDGGGTRYIACGKNLGWGRAHLIAELLGWVDHVIWPSNQAATCFYAASAYANQIREHDGVLLLPRRSC